MELYSVHRIGWHLITGFATIGWQLILNDVWYIIKVNNFIRIFILIQIKNIFVRTYLKITIFVKAGILLFIDIYKYKIIN